MRLVAMGVVVAVLLVLTGCTPSVDRRTVEGLHEAVSNAAFYRVPTSVPPAPPGTVYRQEGIASAPSGSRAWRVIYHSTDVLGHDILVSGVVVAPSSSVPAKSRVIVSWGHPTTGAAQRCAPSLSLDPFDLIEGLKDLVKAGYVVAATDYPGMGVAGPNAYLIGVSEGNSVLDIARAAQQLRGSDAGNKLLLWGHSQGGQAVIFAGQDAANYAPELKLLGVAAAAPATDLGALLKDDIGDVSGVSIGSYAFNAYASVYGPTYPGATLDSILSDAGAIATPKMAALCLFSQNAALHKLAEPLVGNYLVADPETVEPWPTLLLANTAGASAIPAPLFLAQGGTDALVRPAATTTFAAHECALGMSVTYLQIPNIGHGPIALRSLPTLLPWFASARAGTLAAATCPVAAAAH